VADPLANWEHFKDTGSSFYGVMRTLWSKSCRYRDPLQAKYTINLLFLCDWN